MDHRVAFVTAEDPRLGAAGEPLLRLATELHRRGRGSVIWVAGGEKTSQHRVPVRTLDGIVMRHLPAPMPARSMTSRLFGGAARSSAVQAWRHAFEQDRPGVINVQGFGAGGVHALGLARRTGTPLVLTSRGETLGAGAQDIAGHAGLARAFEEALRRAAAVVAPSRELADDLRERFGASGVQVIPDGLEPMGDRFGWGDIPWQIDGRPVVFSPGPPDAGSGLDLLIEAAARISVGHRLVIGGEGVGLEGLRRWARSRGGAGAVSFPGELTEAQTAAALDHADVVVLPDRQRSSVAEIVRVWQMGTPLVATATRAAVATVHHGMDGLLVPPGRSAPLAECIGRLLIDSRLAGELAAEGRRRVGEFGWAAAAARYDAVFDRATAGRAAPASA